MRSRRQFATTVIVTSLSVACSAENELGHLESRRQLVVTEPVPKGAFDAELRQACGDGDGDTSHFLRRPYLQQVGSSEARVMWTTPEDVFPTVRVTTPDGNVIGELQAGQDPAETRMEYAQQMVHFEDLEPAVTYCYEIFDDKAQWLGRTGFRTAPDAASDAPVSFLAVGDLGTNTSDQLAVRDQMAGVPHDFALILGDLAYPSGRLSDHEQYFFDVYAELLRSVPFFVISGNHEYETADANVFREVFSVSDNGGEESRESWYSFDWGPAHIVGLDTERTEDPSQIAWLEDDLDNSEQPWKIVMLHRPPYSSGAHGSSGSVRSTFVPIFEKYGVDLVLAGHDHDYERTEPIRGTTYVVAGGGGRGVRAVGWSDFTAYAEAVASFVHVTLDAATLKLNAIDAVGRDFDSVTLYHD